MCGLIGHFSYLKTFKITHATKLQKMMLPKQRRCRSDLRCKEMMNRLEKLLGSWNGKGDIIQKCLTWVEKIVDDDNRNLASILADHCVTVLSGT